MKIKNLIVVFALGLFMTRSHAQSPNMVKNHYLNFGPQVSYDIEQEKTLLGIGAGYEYRLTQQWGLTVNVNYNHGTNDNGQAVFANNWAVNLLNVANHSISAGGKFYLRRFYLSADLGYGTERKKLQYADERETGWEDNPGLYQCYGVGYQFPIKNNILEIFANGNGVKALKITSGIRLNFKLN
ncbi:MAG TPA: outer membrane beta-barrel protein [Pedobacter sp.]|uniref:outer membrane beta-barrel protein n=1 Tax=Pedobacter sp. TaxID=1411316 RepID=UPI002BC86349|nr:outer membrane beta-barrel protein [Pedobacter sp.]HMI02373.1 outer membrane beta-barrel protein [Pedobacter sp.]